MKIRTDFVTNSSSSSFGTAATEVVTTILAAGGVGVAIKTAEAAIQAAIMDALKQGATSAAQAVKDTWVQDAENRALAAEKFLNDADRDFYQQQQSIGEEIKQYEKQFEDFQTGADTSDPGYQKMKDQYDNYFKYLNDKMTQIDAQRYEIAVEKAEMKAKEDSKSEWVRQRQQDLMTVMEEKAFLKAGIQGYGSAGYDTKAMQDRIHQLSQREAELNGTLRENQAQINYKPMERDPIGPGREFDTLGKQRMAELESLENEKRQASLDAQKRRELEERMIRLRQEMEDANRSAINWDYATKSAEITQVIADAGVDALSNVTGPAGKTIKTIYTGAKGLAGGIGTGMAEGDMGTNILKGTLKGASDIAKDKLGEAYGDTVKNTFTTASEGIQGGVDAWSKGESVLKGTLKGGAKGVIEVVGNNIQSTHMPPTSLPNLDFGKYGVKEVLKGIRGGNPILTGAAKDALADSARNAFGDQVKNLVKGDDVIFSGFKTGIFD